MSKLHSLPESMELSGEEYNPPNATGYPTAVKQKSQQFLSLHP